MALYVPGLPSGDQSPLVSKPSETAMLVAAHIMHNLGRFGDQEEDDRKVLKFPIRRGG